MTAFKDFPRTEPDVLIEEARRRQRRRRTFLAGVAVLIALGAIATGVVAIVGSRAHRHASPAPSRSSAHSATVATVPLKQPTSLAISATGMLYVVDPARDQILMLLPSDRFAVFAGSGKQGFSGDGGPAKRADLRINGSSQIAVASDGTVYIADTGNDRVRAVLPTGVIETVAGTGRSAARSDQLAPSTPKWKGARPALSLAIGSPRGVALGQHGDLYFDGGNNLLSLSLRHGTLTWLAGWQDRRLPSTTNETLESYFSDDYGNIAVDRAGNVYVANFPGLYERTADGDLRFLGYGFRSGGRPAPMAIAPGGQLYMGSPEGILRVNVTMSVRAPGGQLVATSRQSLIPNRRVDDAVGAGWLRMETGAGSVDPPAGLAISHDGTVYFDSDASGWLPPAALVEVTRAGRVHVLWRGAN